MQAHAVGHERVGHGGTGVGVVARQHARRRVEQVHGAAETRESLRELAADGAGADDRELRGPGAQREDRLTRVVCGLASARPGIGGRIGDEPVAITTRRADSVRSPTSTRSSSTKRAAPRKTSTPACV